jgi:hypothetical protein
VCDVGLQVIEASLIGVLLIIIHVIVYLTLFQQERQEDAPAEEYFKVRIEPYKSFYR